MDDSRVYSIEEVCLQAYSNDALSSEWIWILMKSRQLQQSVQQHDRWGIDEKEAAQTRALPPLKASRMEFSFHHQAKAQENELRTLTEAFQRHLELNRVALPLPVQLQQVLDSFSQQQQQQELVEEEQNEDDLAAARRLATRLLPQFPSTCEFLVLLLNVLEDLIRAKIREESSKKPGPEFLQLPSLSLRKQMQTSRHVDQSCSFLKRLALEKTWSVAFGSSVSEDPAGAKAQNGEEGEEEEGADQDQVQLQAADEETHRKTKRRDARDEYFDKKNTFRETLRSRNFPPSRVPKNEYITRTFSYTPLTAAKLPCDLSCVELCEPDSHTIADTLVDGALKQQDLGDQQQETWRVIEFPRPKPRLCPEQIQWLTQWMVSRLQKLEEQQVGKPMIAQFRAQMELNELFCYEMTRLVFDKCPTSARFLHGLYREFLTIAFQALDHAQKEAIVLQQRHKNVSLEISRLQRTAANHHSALEQLKQLLRSREHALGSAREKIIRKRKKINILLASDQVVVRSLLKIVHTVLEIASGSASGNTTSGEEAALGHHGSNASHGNHTGDSGGVGVSLQIHQSQHQKFTLIDELLEFVLTRYDNLKLIRAFRKQQEQTRRDKLLEECFSSALSTSDLAPVAKENVIILSSLDLKVAHRDFTSQTRRLDRLLSERCPDCTLGWNAQEVWDQALFIPPYEDIEDLEAEVASFVQLVEKGIHDMKLDRSSRLKSVGTQTDPVTDDEVQESVGLNKSSMATTNTSGTSLSWSPTRQPLAPRVLPEDDDDLELNDWLRRAPVGFGSFFSVSSFPMDYAPVQYSIATVHNIISFLFNEIIKVVQEEMDQGKDLWSDNPTTHECTCVWYIYRVYMAHLSSPTFVNVCLMDLIVSLSRLDSQSCKIDLFCRLIQVNGVEKLPNEAFWFVLKAIFALQRSTISNGGYFLLDDDQQDEFVPQASAWEAIQLIFGSQASNDMLKRLRTKLAGLASVYGTIWIPAYSILTILLDEWRLERSTIRDTLESRMVGLIKREEPLEFAEFQALLEPLELKLNHLQLVNVYRDAICAAASVSEHVASASAGPSPTEEVNRVFYQQSIKMILEELATSQKSFHMLLVPVAEPLVLAQQVLSFRFLNALWHQNKTTLIHRLDTKFPHAIGIRLRCVHQMENVLETGSKSSAWFFFQQLVCLLY